jgi:hypothetical protein
MNPLTDRLASAADEMTGSDYADLRRRVYETSRRLGYRRAALGSLAMLVVLAVGGVAGLRLLPRSHAIPGPAGSPTPTVTAAPSSTAVPSPDGTSATPSPGRSSAPAIAVPGTLTYLRTAGGPLSVTTVTDGGAPRTRTFGPVPTGQHVFSVSPDGTRIAMILSPDPGNVAPGDLVVVEPGGTRHMLASGIGWGGGIWPYWTPDGKQLLVRKADGPWMLVDVASGKTSTGPAIDSQYAQYFAWSPSGTYRAYASGDTAVVTRADWSVVSRTSTRNLAGCPVPEIGCAAVQAVSDDGRYVAVGVNNTDPGHVAGSALVLDTRTGRAAPLPKLSGPLSKVFFRPGGGMVLESASADGRYTLYAVGADGTVAATVTETGRPGDLVGYHP